MEKESKLFDKRFVHFMWDDELEGKKVFVADYIGYLHALVEKGNEHDLHEVRKNDDVDAPFQANYDLNFTFAYYDPNYEVKKAFKEGKEIQFQSTDGEWNSIVGEDMLKWYIEEGCKLRVKPECPCADGIDSKACVGCEHSEDGKPHPFENYHCYGCDKSSEKEYKPYETVHEFIKDFQERFPTTVPRPAHTMPLIWLKEKEAERINLCYAFVGNCAELGCGVYNMTELFEDWTYLDGDPVGMEVKK